MHTEVTLKDVQIHSHVYMFYLAGAVCYIRCIISTWISERGYESFLGCGSKQRWPLNTLWPRQNGRQLSRRHFQMHFYWMKLYEFRLKCHCILFPRVQITLFQHWFRQWLGAGQATSHYLNQWWLVYWRIYASLGLNELINRRPICTTGLSVLLRRHLDTEMCPRRLGILHRIVRIDSNFTTTHTFSL